MLTFLATFTEYEYFRDRSPQEYGSMYTQDSFQEGKHQSYW